MIGQKELLERIKRNIIDDTLSHFITLCAPEGFGKHTLCTEISNLLNADIIFIDNKVDSIRSAISMIYNQAQPIVYVFEDADSMSLNSKNSLLKVCEEPPQSAYIILLVENKENILQTLLSRTQLYEFDNYTNAELLDYLSMTENHNNISTSIAQCPGDINKLLLENNKNLFTFANKVVINLGKVALSNALKITKQISLNKDSNGLDSRLFLNAIINICRDEFKNTKDKKYLQLAELTSNTKYNLTLSCNNKNYEFDNFIIKGWSLWNCQN